MKKWIIKTSDGKTLNVFYDNENYSYSIDSQTIDSSDLIKKISENEPNEKIEIDVSEFEKYIADNEVTDEFKELYKFIVCIFESYNKAIDDLEDVEL